MKLFKSFSNYLSLVKFSHTIFAMPFALIGFFLGLHKYYFYTKGIVPGWHIEVLMHKKVVSNLYLEFGFLLLKIVLCMIFARSAAMAFNRYIDEKFDKLNPRTAVREIPAGIIKKQHALSFIIINSVLFIATTFFINTICFYLSPIALFVILFYSYTKRFTPLCHLVLGVGLGLAPIGAYLSVTGFFDVVPILFSFVVLTWVSGFDILYALQDEDFDRAHNLKSIPVLLGRKKAMIVSNTLHIISAAIVVSIGFLGNFNFIYWIGATVFICLLTYQHILVKPNDISKINLAFMTTNGIASVVFAIFVIIALFMQ